MCRLITVAFLVGTLAVTLRPSFVYPYTGYDLVEAMNERDKAEAHDRNTDWVKAKEYGAYILGVYDTTKFLYNVPPNATTMQVFTIVGTYLKNHPGMWDETASVLIMNALTEVFGSRK